MLICSVIDRAWISFLSDTTYTTSAATIGWRDHRLSTHRWYIAALVIAASNTTTSICRSVEWRRRRRRCCWQRGCWRSSRSTTRCVWYIQVFTSHSRSFRVGPVAWIFFTVSGLSDTSLGKWQPFKNKLIYHLIPINYWSAKKTNLGKVALNPIASQMLLETHNLLTVSEYSGNVLSFCVF